MITGEDMDRLYAEKREAETNKDIHDEILVVFINPITQEETEITIINLIEGGIPIETTHDMEFPYVRTIRRPKP